MRMLCVDPGLRGCGVAEFVDNTLTRAVYVKNPIDGERGYRPAAVLASSIFWKFYSPDPDLLIVEHPRFYGSVHQKGDPNDTLDCGIVGSAVASRFVAVMPIQVHTVFPSDWKGQVPKQKMLARIKAAILPEELPRVQQTNKSDMEDVIDAIGIGFWKLGRINARKIHND